MAKGPETRLQRKIREALTKRFPDLFMYKVHGGPYQRAGVPDLIACLDGKFIGLEVKVGNNQATALQAQTLEKIRQAGGTAGVVRSVEEAVELVEEALGTRS